MRNHCFTVFTDRAESPAAVDGSQARGANPPPGATAEFDDAKGTPAYRFLKFPPGEEGERLKALFDRHVHGCNPLDDSAPSR
jgi:hypothetical protein